MASVAIVYTEEELRRLVYQDMENKLGDDVVLDEKKVKIEVKSKQNFKAEWEDAAFRTTYADKI